MTAGRVLVTGGAGYVGSALVPKLLASGRDVTVIDLFLYGEHVLPDGAGDRLRRIKGDIRDKRDVLAALKDCTDVVHLACISNDPSFELDPALGKSINLDAFRPLVIAARDAGVRRFVYASSSSVYGIKETREVTEDLALEPLTDYSRFKADCEVILQEERRPGFAAITIRPATVCGWAPRLRLDVAVNILTNLAINKGQITVFGGSQLRPNIHIDDMTDLYVALLDRNPAEIDGKVFNAGFDNFSMADIAKMVRLVVERETGREIDIVTTPTDDLRSYHISSAKIAAELGWRPRRTLLDAIEDLTLKFKEGAIPNSLDDIRYFNIKTMQAAKLS